MDEPNPDELISAGTLKSLTGNDSYWARDLFQRGKEAREITPFFKLHMICNKLPGIKDADEATWDRIRVIPFESKFLPESECPSHEDDMFRCKIFPENKNFKHNMSYILQPLAWFLINRLRYYNKFERIVPEKVKIATAAYKQDNNIYKQFADEFIDDSSENGKITGDVLYCRFKEWFRDSVPGHQIPSKAHVIDRYCDLWKTVPTGVHKTFHGVTFREEIKDCTHNALLF